MQAINGSSVVVAWIRRRAERQGLDGVSQFVDVCDNARRLHELWNARFPHCPYLKFRAFLARVAEQHSALQRIDDWRTADAEWIAPIDDDDWHLPGLAEALETVPPEFVMACWPVHVAYLTTNPRLEIEPIHWITGPHSCGYAIRKWWLETLTPRQFALIRDDHRHVHRYVDFGGHKYLFLDQPFAQYVHTPASISSITSPEAASLNLATVEEYARLLVRCPPGVQEITQRLAAILPKLVTVPFSFSPGPASGIANYGLGYGMVWCSDTIEETGGYTDAKRRIRNPRQ